MHQHVEGSKRTQQTSVYPLPLLKAILQGVSDTRHSANLVDGMVEVEYEANRLMNVSPEQATAQQGSTSLPPLGLFLWRVVGVYRYSTSYRISKALTLMSTLESRYPTISSESLSRKS